MAQDGYPADLRTWQSYQAIEADAAAHARYCVFTTPGAARMYQQRYPAQPLAWSCWKMAMTKKALHRWRRKQAQPARRRMAGGRCDAPQRHCLSLGA